MGNFFGLNWMIACLWIHLTDTDRREMIGELEREKREQNDKVGGQGLTSEVPISSKRM